jgi:hypothetical protein
MKIMVVYHSIIFSQICQKAAVCLRLHTCDHEMEFCKKLVLLCVLVSWTRISLTYGGMFFALLVTVMRKVCIVVRYKTWRSQDSAKTQPGLSEGKVNREC